MAQTTLIRHSPRGTASTRPPHRPTAATGSAEARRVPPDYRNPELPDSGRRTARSFAAPKHIEKGSIEPRREQSEIPVREAPGSRSVRLQAGKAPAGGI